MALESSSSKILIGLSLHSDDSKETLSWAIKVVAHPNDTIVAVHVLVAEGRKKRDTTSKRQSQIRQAKAYVISVLGEFARTCRSKQVNLEARVKVSSNVGRGLVEEAQTISADILVLSGPRNKSNKTRTSNDFTKYCFEKVPESCTVVSIGKCGKAKQTNLDSNSAHCKSCLRWSNKEKESNYRSASPVSKLNSGTKALSNSPTTVLEALEGQSNSTEDDTFSTRVSTISEASSAALRSTSQSMRKLTSPCRLIASFIGSPFRKRSSSLSKKEKNPQPLLKCFGYEEISNATNNFHPGNIVGRGGYSEVYRGDLPDGRTIAVKQLAKDNSNPNKEKEFLIELGIIVHVSHPNTAKLLGCCIENGLYLVFNFSQNGNLSTALHGKLGNSLEWPVRYNIAIGVARGLHYLHKCCKHRIIHRDIKASNVLLGPDYEPQITDFGLAKWLPNKWTHHAFVPIEGTFGYLAPEYFMHGIVDEKTDVYAFGVLLLELVTGRRPVDSSKQSLLLWAKPLMESGNVAELADPKLGGKYDSEQLFRVVLAASDCVRQSPIWRPSISEVLELLICGQQESEIEAQKSGSIPKFTSDELDDYSMVY